MTAPPDRKLPRTVPLLTASEMRAWDRSAIASGGVPERLLMEVAGRAAARLLDRIYPEGTVAAVVGRGNNGGDALVLLRCLSAWGREVVAVPVDGAPPREELLHGCRVPLATGPADVRLREAAVVVDGILGTGALGAPREPEAAMIRAVLGSGRPVVSLDGPSGVDMTDGSVPGEAVRADLTVTFGAPKRGLLLHPGRAHAGRVIAVEVGFPPLEADGYGAELITAERTMAHLPRLPPNAHKGDAGTVVVVAGRPGMGGAAILCATGALRAGAGVVRVVSCAANRIPIQSAVPEAIFVEREGEEVGTAFRAADAIVLGPGMGTDEPSLDLLREALRDARCPVVLDADALTCLAREGDAIARELAGRAILTPHPGEMGRLLGRSTAEVLGDPFGAATDASARYGCVVLLKGSPTLVAEPGTPTLVNTTGHSGVATGGMGDTLCGVAGALLGAGASVREAAAAAIWLAGSAAEIAGRGRSLLPRDVAAALPEALAPSASLADHDFPDVILDLPPTR